MNQAIAFSKQQSALAFYRFILHITFRFTQRFKLPLAAAAALLQVGSPGLRNICYRHQQ